MNGSRPRRASAQTVARLRRTLSERDLLIIASVIECRFLTSGQLQRWHFPCGEGLHTPGSGARVARRVLARLNEQRLLVRLSRRIGGVRAGSSGHVYAAGPIGQRVLYPDRPPRRFNEPSTAFLDHTLAVSEIVVRLAEADRAGAAELLECQTEPDCWRRFNPLSGSVLKPDLRVTLGVGAKEQHWFVEVDQGTVHLPSVIRKCRVYQDYFRSGAEQSQAGVFPRVLWLTTPARVKPLQRAIARDLADPRELFMVAEQDAAPGIMIDPRERP